MFQLWLVNTDAWNFHAVLRIQGNAIQRSALAITWYTVVAWMRCLLEGVNTRLSFELWAERPVRWRPTLRYQRH